MKDAYEIKEKLRAYKPIIKERFKVKNIGIFGSFARGEQTLKSDIDILVEFDKEGKTFRNYMELNISLRTCWA